jgi:hypothetical protein
MRIVTEPESRLMLPNEFLVGGCKYLGTVQQYIKQVNLSTLSLPIPQPLVSFVLFGNVVVGGYPKP